MLLEDILIIIFDKLPLVDLLQCSVVSKSWFKIINNNVKLRNKIQLKLNENTFNKYSQLNENMRRAHLSLTIENVNIKDCHAPSFTSIRHLWLEFCTIQSVMNVKRLIEGLPNLETFKFRPTYNEKVISTLMPSDETSPVRRSLNYLEITMFPEVSDPDNAWNVMRCFELIPMKVQKIHLKLFCGKDVTQANNLKTILNYINTKHGLSVRKLTILICKTEVIRAVYELLVRLTHIQLDEHEINSSLADNFERSIVFLQNQNSLKHLTTQGLPLMVLHTHWICENLQNLVTLNLDCGKLNEINLGYLTSLEDLRLFFPRASCNIIITVPIGLRTLQAESKTEIELILLGAMEKMKKIRLIDCKLTPMILEEMGKHMPNLKTCEFPFTSKNHDSNLPSYLLPWKNIRKLVLPPWMMDDLVLFSIQSRELKTLDLEFGFELVDLRRCIAGLEHLAQICPLLHQIYEPTGNTVLYKRILIIIFDKLPLPVLLQCSLVSQSWFDIINSNVKLRNKMQLKLNEKNFNEFIQLTKQNRRVHSSLTMESIYFYDYRAFDFASIRHLSLEFCFVQSVRNVKRLIEGLPNLETFKFRPTIYEKVMSTLLSSDKTSSTLRSLKHLEIFLYPTIADQENAWNVMRCFQLIPMEIQKIHLNLVSVFDVDQTENLKTILNYIDANYGNSVKKLTFMAFESDAIREVYKHLDELKNIQLDELEINSSPDQCEFSIRYLQKQTSLRHLRVVSRPMLPPPQLLRFCDSLKNLVTLDLDCGKLDEIPLDRLNALEDLRLKFCNPTTTIAVPAGLRNLEIKSAMKSANVNLLVSREMENMEKFCLRYCWLTPMLLEKVVTQMPNLKTFEYFSRSFGCTGSSYLLPWKHLRKLVLPAWMMDDSVLFSIRSRDLKTLDIANLFVTMDLQKFTAGLQHVAKFCPLLNQIYELTFDTLVFKRVDYSFVHAQECRLKTELRGFLQI